MKELKDNKEIEWTCTDPDNFQFGRMIREGVYEFKEFDRNNYSEKFAELLKKHYEEADNVIEGVFNDSDYWTEIQVSLVDYNDVEIDNHVSAYYSSLEKLKEECGEDWMWIAAECIFEQESGLY